MPRVLLFYYFADDVHFEVLRFEVREDAGECGDGCVGGVH